MNNETTNGKSWRLFGATGLFFWLTTLVSVLLLIAALKIRSDFSIMPANAIYVKIELLRASLFVFALSIGLFGSVFALVAPPSRRGFGSAITLFACAQLAFAFVAKSLIMQHTIGHSVSLILLVIPAALCFGSLILAVTTGFAAKPAEEPLMEEPQLPLSQP